MRHRLNWYKNAKSYMDIGHSVSEEEVGVDYILWRWNKGRIEKSRIYNSVNDAITHYGQFGEVKELAGRYDVTNNVLSIAVENGSEYLYEKVVGRILRSFPDAKEVWVFDNFGRSRGKRIAGSKWGRLSSTQIFDINDGVFTPKDEVIDSILEYESK